MTRVPETHLLNSLEPKNVIDGFLPGGAFGSAAPASGDGWVLAADGCWLSSACLCLGAGTGCCIAAQACGVIDATDRRDVSTELSDPVSLA